MSDDEAYVYDIENRESLGRLSESLDMEELMRALFELPVEVWHDRDDVVAEYRAQSEADDYQQSCSEYAAKEGDDLEAEKASLEPLGVQKWFRFPGAHVYFQRWLYLLLPERVRMVGGSTQVLAVTTHEGGVVTADTNKRIIIGDTPLEAAEVLRELAYMLEHQDG